MRITVDRKLSMVAVLAVALVISATLIWKASFATFAVTTSNPSNAWTSGNLVLQAQDGNGASVTGAAVFSATGLVPSATVLDKCITVVYSGNVTAGSVVHLYSTTTSNTAALNAHQLSSYISLQIDEATTNATDVNCTGFVAAATPLFDTTHRSGATSASVIAGSLMDFTTNQTTYASGTAAGWTPAAAPASATKRSYRFRIKFPGSATVPGGGSNTIDTDLMNMTSQTTFTWEVQS